MGRIVLILAFLLAFLITLVVNVPARFVLDRVNPAAQGLYYERVSGSVWSGRMTGSVVAGQPIGTVDFRLRPGDLFSMSLTYDVSLRGPTGTATGTLRVTGDRSVGVELPRARINVQELRRLEPRLRQVPSELVIQNLLLKIDSNRACRQGRGRIRTDVLEALGGRFAWNGPEMVGTVECLGGDIVVVIDSQTSEDTISARLVFDGKTGIFDLNARVQTPNAKVRQAVQQLGFQPDGEAFVYRYGNRPQDRPGDVQGQQGE
jgi:hypothetical protein